MRKTKVTFENWWNPENLNTLMNKCGLSEDKISEASDIPKSSLRNYMSGKAQPTADRLLVLADIFAVPLDYLYGRCTKEECDAIEESFLDNFRILRRVDYENLTLKRIDTSRIPQGYDAPYPYNLLDDILGVPFDHIITEDEERGLNIVVSYLSPREQLIIKKRYKNEMTLETIGNEIHLTRDRIRQIQAKALRKMRHPAMLNYIRYGGNNNTKKLELEEWSNDLRRRERELAALQNQVDIRETGIDKDKKFEVVGYGWDDPEYDAVHHSPNGKYTYPSDAFNDLQLSVRSSNCLKRAKCESIADIVKMIRDGSIIKIRNLGKHSLREIIEKVMKNTGMSFEEVVGGLPLYDDLYK